MTPLLLPLLLSAAPVQDDAPLDLVALQARVDAVLAAAVPATVGLRVGRQNGTGVLVSADGLVLTAGHVITEPGLEVVVTLHDGTELDARTLGLNSTRDSGMVQVVDAEGLPFVPVPPAGATPLGTWLPKSSSSRPRHRRTASEFPRNSHDKLNRASRAGQINLP